MDIQVEEKGVTKREVTITIDKETVNSHFDKEYKQLKATANIKGFRKGKAPLSEIERVYGKDVVKDIYSLLVQESLTKVFDEHKFDIVGKINTDKISDLKKNSDFTIKINFEIAPELEDLNYKGLELTKNVYKLKEEDIENQLVMLQEKFALPKPIKEERKIQDKDFVAVELIEALKEKEDLKKIFSDKDRLIIEIGNEKHMTKDFQDQLVGLSKDEEKSFSVTFDDEIILEGIRGQQIDFKIKIQDIMFLEKPAIDDELAKKVQKDSLEELKEEIRVFTQQEYDKISKQELYEACYKKMLEQQEFEVPEALVQEELARIMQEIQQSYEGKNYSLDFFKEKEEELKERYYSLAEEKAKRFIVLHKLIAQNNLKVENADLEDYYTKMSQSAKVELEQIKSFYEKNKEAQSFLKNTILEQKAIDLILDNANISEKEVGIDKEKADI